MIRLSIKRKGGKQDAYVSSMSWGGSKTEVARKLELHIVNAPLDKNITPLTINLADPVYLFEDDGKTELFRGYVVEREASSTTGTVTYTCYDLLFYTIKSNATYNFSSKTAEAITQMVCDDMEIPVGSLAQTGLTQKLIVQNVSIYLLDILTLSDVKRKKIAQLSGGMKRRVGIAQAMLNDPKILVMDEPTAGLDPGERVRFRNFISEFSHDRIVLISTHIVSDIEYIATRNAIMKAGKIIDVGTTSDLVKQIEGKVWSCAIPAHKMMDYEMRLRIINQRGEDNNQISMQIVISLVGLISVLACVYCTFFLSAKCKDTLTVLLIAIGIVLIPTFAYTALGVNWISAIFPSAGLGMQNNFLYQLINFNYLHIGGMSFWTPYTILISALIEIPVFLFLTVRTYCRHQM